MKFNRFISFTELKYLGLKKGEGGGDKPEFTGDGTLDFSKGGGEFSGSTLECTVGHFNGSTLDLT